MANDMENAHVARVSNDKQSSDNKSSSGKSDSANDVRDVKANDDGKEIGDKSSNKNAVEKSKGSGSDISKQEEIEEKERKDKKKEKKAKEKKNPMKQLNKANAIGTGAHVGMHIALTTHLILMMKMLFQGVTTAVSNFLTTLFGWVGTAINAVGGAFGSIGGAIGGFISTVASAIGVSATAVAVAAIVAFTGGVGSLVVSVFVATSNAITAQRDEKVEEDCATSDISQATAAGMNNVDANAQMMQYAQQTYTVYKHYGFSDRHIAAVLANWQGESSMDPTSIESVFGEQYNINGPKHQSAIASNFDMNVYNPSAAMEVYSGSPPKPSGIGFAGYTAENATALINYAKTFNKNWWDFDVQVAFSMDENKGYASAKWLQTTFKSKSYSDLATPVRAYVEEFERPKWPEAAVTQRTPYAETWYARIMHGTDGFNKNDTTIKASVISMVGAASTAGADSAASSARSQCKKLGNCYDNSNIAAAAASLALPPGTSGLNNDGSETYQKVHDAIFGAANKKSCDNLSATAVRWSGSDNDYPQGATNSQDEHVVGHPDKWEIVKPTSGGVGTNSEFFVSANYSADNLPTEMQPGDVVMEYSQTNHSGGREHTWVYTGEEALTAVYPENGTNAAYHYNAVSASWPDTGPECRHANPGHTYFCLFRCKQVEADPKYKDAGASFTNSSSGTANCTSADGEFIWPLPGAPSSYTVTSMVGSNEAGIHDHGHKGTDIAATTGTNILAAMEGEVVLAEDNGGGFGNHVIIRHQGKQLITIYGHMSKITTSKGATVKAGDKIGEVGSTGHSTGPHLHFECRKEFPENSSGWYSDGVVYDPLKYEVSDNITFPESIVKTLHVSI